MEIGDFEAANEFEFDLSDVDVAAFESVATEDTTTPTTTNTTTSHEQQIPSHQLQPPQSPQSIKSSALASGTAPAATTILTTDTATSDATAPTSPTNQTHSIQAPQQPPPKQQQEVTHHVAQLAQATGGQQGKILLVPINSKTGSASFKHLLQLPAGATPLTMGALSTSGNKKHIIQLAPLSTSSFNMSKNNYPFPVSTTTNQLLPGSSQGQKQQQLYFATSTNSSPMKHQQAFNLNNVLNKSLGNLQNNNSLPSHFTSANLSLSRNMSFNERASTPNPIAAAAANEVPKRKPCNCTKSQCLKLYCDCFANGEFCSGCNCTNCFNSLSKEKERQKAITQCLERNPEAFRPKIGKAIKSSLGAEPAPESIERRHTKGCNCKRSGCLKNYCECYEAKILCSNLCKCCGCKNYEESFERKSLMQLANSASEHARGILKNLLPTNSNSNTGKEFTKCFITDKVIHASLMCLLQSAQQAEKDGILPTSIPNLIQTEMGKCLRMIVDSATEAPSPKKR